jgi:gas vesicle protein
MEAEMKYLVGFLAGTVFGAAVALLYAPTSGEELRESIRTEADSRYHQMQEQWQHGMTELQGRLDKINAELKNSIDQLRAQQSKSSPDTTE